MNASFWKSKKVFLTGHTGFKGGWLGWWLHGLGAEVMGYALSAPTNPSLFESTGLGSVIKSCIADVRDLVSLRSAIHEFRPEIVIHMAAQPLVRESYNDPVDTFSTNVMGTAHVLEASRTSADVKVVLNVTTDKCYENKEWDWPYREADRLGGRDPYSSSKACSELVTAAYRQSYFPESSYAEHGVAIASARAGNVIGGGDWAKDRLIPDIWRSIEAKEPIVLRHPEAIRPWQHVLEPLRGYLMLCEQLYKAGDKFTGAWNFGPNEDDCKNVAHIANRMLSFAGSSLAPQMTQTGQPHEATLLKLATNKAKAHLGWYPALSLDDALRLTIEWHQHPLIGSSPREITLRQIDEYMTLTTNHHENT